MSRPAITHAPTLAAITLNPTGGGIAAVSYALWRVVQEEWGPRARLLTMFDHRSRPATFAEKTRFTMALTTAEALGRTDWILFTHLGLAKIQNAVPARLRRPYGVFLHGIEAWGPLGAGEQRALAAADVRLANSRYTAARVMHAHPKIGVVESCPLALCPAPGVGQRPVVAATPIPPLASHVVLVVGRMCGSERYKGHDQLIEAWPHVIARVPEAQLVIVGDGDDAPRLRQKAVQSGVGQRILFTGFVPRATLEELYRRAALFALPSRGEGFGLVYLEAMTHALACVGSVHDAAREVIVDGQTGRLVDQNDIDGLADTLATLLMDDAQRQRMGDAGHGRLLTEFNVDRFSERLSALLPSSARAAAATT